MSQLQAMVFLRNRATGPTTDCLKADAHGNAINIDKGTIIFAGHPHVVALASFIVVAGFWVATLAITIWTHANLPPKVNSHDLRRNKWTTIAVVWFLGYLTTDAALRFLQYHGYEFPIEVMYTELARVKPQGLAEYFCFVAILRCEDVFKIGNITHANRLRRMRLFFLVLLTVIDLIASAADYYSRISMIMETVSILDKTASSDNCLANTIYGAFKTYADILFYAFSLVCCVFFTFIVAKFKTFGLNKAVKTYRRDYSIVVAAFWVHCIQCLVGTLVFDEFGINSTQTTEFIYVVIYDMAMFILLLFLLKLKKLELDPDQCHYEDPGIGAYPGPDPDKPHVAVNIQADPLPMPQYAGMPYNTTSFNNRQDFYPNKVPTTTSTSYMPVNQFATTLH